MITFRFDFSLALAIFSVISTTASALQSDGLLAGGSAETGQPHTPIADETIKDIRADRLNLLRSRQRRLAKNRATQGPTGGKVFASATPREEDRTSLNIHIFCIATVGLALIFTLASCCAVSGGPSSTNTHYTGSVIGQSCFAFPDPGRKHAENYFNAAEHLLVSPHALKVGNSSSPFVITEPDGREAFHVKVVDGPAALISNISLRRCGSNLSLQSVRVDPTAQAIEIFNHDGTPLIAVTSKMQIFNMMDRSVVARLGENSKGLFELTSPQGWSPHVFIERLPTGALIVTPPGIRCILATAVLVHSFPWQRDRLEIAFGPDVAAQPRMKITLLGALLGSTVFQGQWISA